MELVIKNLHAKVEDKEILKGVNLVIKTGEMHAIMGPNGTGKSTLSAVIMGHPKFQVTEGSIELNGENILEMSVDERSRKGLFLAMQYPNEIPLRGPPEAHYRFRPKPSLLPNITAIIPVI